MRNFKRIIAIIISAVMLISVSSLTAFAAGSASIALSAKTLEKGKSLTVTVTINGGQAMYSTGCSVSYDTNILKFVSGDMASSGNTGSITIIGTPAGATKQSYKLNFTAVGTGSCTISATNIQYVPDGDINAAEVSVGSQAVKVNVTDVSLSDNANLSSLKLGSGTLSPKFSSSKTSYTAQVPYSVTDCKIYATAADSNAKVQVSGSSGLEVGKNTRKVTVTAASGKQKVYTIVITRLEEDAVSSNDSSSEDTGSSEPPENPDEGQIIIDGAAQELVQDFSEITLPDGFSTTTAIYNNTEVTVVTDIKNQYNIFYLLPKDADKPVLYTYDKQSDDFSKLKYLMFTNEMYIVLEPSEDNEPPEGYYYSNLKTDDFTAKCFALNDTRMADFRVLYCYAGGESGYYRYDTAENVIQRDPAFEPLKLSDVKGDSGNILSRFNQLSGNGKIILLSLLAAAAAVIALIILFIVKLAGARSAKRELSSEASVNPLFDEIMIQDAFDDDIVSHSDISSDKK